ncbi:MAG: porin family protein [Bryobacteraceae bacterium]
MGQGLAPQADPETLPPSGSSVKSVHKRMRSLLLAALLLAPAASAQLVSVGVRGGVPFTGGFSSITDVPPPDFDRSYSGSKEYIVGAMVELHLPLGFSVEADALYHPLNLSSQVSTGTAVYTDSTTYNSFEFPVVAKYRFLHLPLVKPFVEAGPSFRAAATAVNYLSHEGLTLGGGVEIKLGRLRLEPELRYIRWRADTMVNQDNMPVSGPSISNLNQAELLVGIAF